MEAMAASVKLALESDVVAGMQNIARGLEELDAKLVASQEKITGLADSFSEIGKGARSFERAATALNSLEGIGGIADGMARLVGEMQRADPEGLIAAAGAMRTINGASQAGANVAAVADAMGLITDHLAGMSGAADAMERMSNARAPAGWGRGGLNAGSGNETTAGGSVHEGDGTPLGPAWSPSAALGSVPSFTPAPGQPSPWGSPAARKAASSHHDPLMPALIAAGLGHEIFGLGESAFMAAGALDQRRATMLAQGVRPADADALINTARTAAQNTPGLTYEQSLEAGMDLRFVLGGTAGNPGDTAPAMSVLPMIDRNLAILGKLGDAKGDEAFAGMKAAELFGDLIDEKTGGISSARMAQTLEGSAAVAVASQGRVLPHDYLAFAKRARVSDLDLDPEFMTRVLPSLFMETGGSIAGTGEMAMWRQFAGGTMTEAKFDSLKDLGLVDKSATWSHGHADDIGHHLADARTFNENPAQWVWNTLEPALAAHGITDRVAQAQYAGTLMTNTGGGIVSALIAQETGIRRDMTTIGNAQTGLGALNTLDAGAMSKMGDFQAGFHNMLADLGGPLLAPSLKAMDDLRSVFGAIGTFAHEHPQAAATLEKGGGVGAVLGAGLGGFLGSPAGLVGIAAGAGAGAAVGGVAGVGVAETLGSPSLLLHHLAPLAEPFMALMLRIHDKLGGDGGRMKVELPDKVQKVQIINEGDLVNRIGDHLATELNAPPSGPGVVDPRYGGQHPGQHN